MSTDDLSPADLSSARRLVAAAVSLALGSAASSAIAQTSEPQEKQLPKISVESEPVDPAYKVERPSSPKYTAPLRDIPQTVVVIPKTLFAEQGARTLTDVLRNTPGITLLAGEGGGASNTAGDSLFMRGFDATNNIFIDGVRDQGAYGRDVFNLEQVEIAKGPSGSYTGRGNAAGSINLVTKRPGLEAFQSGGVRYGTNDHKRATFDLNQPLGVGPLEGTAVRFNALWQDGGTAGRNEVQQDTWAIAPSFATGLGTSTRISLTAQILRQDNTPDYGLPTAAYPGLLQTNPPVGEVNQENFYGLVNFDSEDIEADYYTLRVEHDFSANVALSNITRYSENYRRAFITVIQNATAFDPATGLINRVRQANERENENFTHLTNLQLGFSTGALAHTLSTGLELTREEQLNPVWTGLGTAPPADLYNPNPFDVVTGFAPMRAPGDFADGETKTAALYAFDTLKLNDRWQLNAGLRFERYDVEFIDTTPPATTPPTPAPLQLEESDNIVSWNAGVVYKPVEHGSIYLSAANTQSPPGGSNFTLSAVPSNANNPNVDPQESLIYELGTKWDVLGEQLSVTAAIFQAENTNVISTNSTTGEVDFNGEQQVDGFELGLAGQVTDRWGVFGGFSYLDSEFTETINPAQQRATLQWTPKKSANLWTTYSLPMGFQVGGGLAYVDTVFRSSSVATPDAPAPQAPSFTVYYATAAWEANDHVSVRFNVDNVTDEEYVLRLNNNGGRYVPGPSRWYLLSADFSF